VSNPKSVDLPPSFKKWTQNPFIDQITDLLVGLKTNKPTVLGQTIGDTRVSHADGLTSHKHNICFDHLIDV
jgi:hypothetical protein